MIDELSRLTNDDNQNTAYDSNYITETVSEINGIDELTQGMFPIILNIIYQYQRKGPVSMAKLKCETYKHSYFRGVRNGYFKLITCKIKVLVPYSNPKIRWALMN